MFAGPEDDPREEGNRPVGERATLVRYLRDQRLTLELKCAGLDAAGLARRSVEPSSLSLLGLARHLASAEQYWFRQVMAGQQGSRHFRSRPGEDFDGAVPDPRVGQQAWDIWREEVVFAEQFVAAAPDLGVAGSHGEAANPEQISLRECSCT